MTCSECGDRKPLTRDGVCRWRHGCEHRQLVRSARERRVVEEAERIIERSDPRIPSVGFYDV